MAMFSVRVPDDLAGRFDTVAGQAGGRSALLRRLIIEAAAGSSPEPDELRRGPRQAARLMVRLGAAEAAAVDLEARRMGLRRAGWVAALVRHRMLGRPTFSRADEQLLNGVRSELRRIGVNVNQIARALNTAVLEGRVLDLELLAVDDFRRELRGHVAALGEAFQGNVAYWSTDL
jgi:predicted transcriptional regulator